MTSWSSTTCSRRAAFSAGRRVAISDLVATVVDRTYPNSCQEFIELEQAGNEFNAEKISEILIENIDSSARQLFSESFVNTIITNQDWRNNQTKQLFLKVADEKFREENRIGITRSELSEDPNEVHIEHVFPQSFFLHGKEDPYAWLDHFFQSSDSESIANQINLLKERDAHQKSPKSNRYDEIEPIISRIESSFVRDIGNMMLLDEEVNNPIKNRLFSIKLREYHKEHSKDMDNIINNYFKSNNQIPSVDIEKLVQQEIPADETSTGSIPEIFEKYNRWWTYHRLAERKANLVSEILRSLSFQTNPEEFETYQDDINKLVKNDMEKRIAFLTA